MKRYFLFAVITIVLLAPDAFARNHDDFCFVVFGDTQPVAPYDFKISPVTEEIGKEINFINPDFTVHLGDIIYGVSETNEVIDDAYSKAFAFFKQINSKIYFVPGNHEFFASYPRNEFLRITGQKEYFSFNHKDVHFIILNTEEWGRGGRIRGDQLKWLKTDLDYNKNASAIFVFMHSPIFKRAITHTYYEEKLSLANFKTKLKNWIKDIVNRSILTSLFSRYKVTAVIAGHEHSYHEIVRGGVRYYTNSSSGGALHTSVNKGGFYTYLLVSVGKRGVKIEAREPYQFFVDYRYYTKDNKQIAEARIDNYGSEMSVLDLKGLKFTLPNGNYTLKSDTNPSYSQMEKISLDFVRRWGIPKVEASIIRKEPNPSDSTKTDYYVQIKSLGEYSLLLNLAPSYSGHDHEKNHSEIR